MTDGIVVEALGKDFRAPVGWRELARGRLRGRAVTALDGVSFRVAAGEVVAVLGQNGAGKSTLLRCLAGLLEPTRGRATVAGHDAARGDAALRRAAVYVAGDGRSFAWRISGRANLEFFAALDGWRGAERAARVEAALDRVGLSRVDADRRVEAYSTGMRKRLALARALLGDATALLLDEPTAGLDPRAAAEVRALAAARAREGAAIVLATHLLDEAEALAARAIVLDAGRTIYAGPVAGAPDAIHGGREVARG